MGRAIEVDKRQDKSDLRQDDFDRRLKLMEDALEEMIQTRVKHVDLTEDLNVKDHGVELEPDEEFTPPVGKRKKTTKSKTATVA
jgi:hypothetical protein